MYDFTKKSVPITLTCCFCGQKYGTSSLLIHQKRCKMRGDQPIPEIPQNLNKKAVDEFNQKAWEDYSKHNMKKCPYCNRSFLEDRLVVHLRSCKPKLSSSVITSYNDEKDIIIHTPSNKKISPTIPTYSSKFKKSSFSSPNNDNDFIIHSIPSDKLQPDDIISPVISISTSKINTRSPKNTETPNFQSIPRPKTSPYHSKPIISNPKLNKNNLTHLHSNSHIPPISTPLKSSTSSTSSFKSSTHSKPSTSYRHLFPFSPVKNLSTVKTSPESQQYESIHPPEMSCRYCGTTWLPESLLIHEKSCFKNPYYHLQAPSSHSLPSSFIVHEQSSSKNPQTPSSQSSQSSRIPSFLIHEPSSQSRPLSSHSSQPSQPSKSYHKHSFTSLESNSPLSPLSPSSNNITNSSSPSPGHNLPDNRDIPTLNMLVARQLFDEMQNLRNEVRSLRDLFLQHLQMPNHSSHTD